MPANITHMLIAHKALKTLKNKGIDEYTEFANLLDDSAEEKNCRAYVNLGSVGPDLYYYSKMSSSVKDMIKEGFVQAKGVTPWSYHLHSYKPNELPLKLVEIIFRDVVRNNGKVMLDVNDHRKLAYIAGHLTHIAADQIIHPVVNNVAGPYYRSGENRKKHRECEVFQDYFLYSEVYRLEEKTGSKYDFFEQDFNKWADCVRGMTFKNAEDWFRYFLQRGFVETYSASPSEDDIENSVDNLLLVLKVCQQVGPYKKADKEYRKDKENSKMYQEYIKNVDYIRFYRLAVELAVVYLIALYEIYFVLRQGKDFTKGHKKRFLRIVRDADLSCPLEQNIFEKASAALRNKSSMQAAFKKHSSDLLTKMKFVTPKRIFKTDSDKDILKV
ncbi:MAG: zinc dependent phospholipase C family protein [Sedimentisphaerales bacterium]|nr:zinc dependent phospholipase C family protein [Sedimentisphaerales bacterium]